MSKRDMRYSRAMTNRNRIEERVVIQISKKYRKMPDRQRSKHITKDGK